MEKPATQISAQRIYRIKCQGFTAYSDEEIAQYAFGNRFPVVICLIMLGVGVAPHGSPEPIVADEHTPPVGVTFEKAHKSSSGIDIGNLLRNGDFVALWVKRMVAPNADSIVNDVYSIRLIGETA